MWLIANRNNGRAINMYLLGVVVSSLRVIKITETCASSSVITGT